jgi:integrase
VSETPSIPAGSPFSTLLPGAVKRAKVQKVTPHDLGHTCASISISSRVNVLALSRMLGHKPAKVTLDTYADFLDTDPDAVAEALDLKCAQSVPKARPANAPGA